MPRLHSLPKLRRRSIRQLLPLAMASLCGFTGILRAQAPVVGTWEVQAGNWSTPGNWVGDVVPNGIDHEANLTFNITANRVITIDGGIPGSNVTLGKLNIGDSSAGSIYTISGGTLTFDVSTGNAELNMMAASSNNTISSAMVINDLLNIRIHDASNSQGLTLNGKISGGTAGSVTMRLEDLSEGTSLNWFILNHSAGNDFAGQIEVGVRVAPV